MYGVGDSGLTNTKDEDLRVFRLLAKKTKLESHTMDWSGAQPHKSDYLERCWQKFGVDVARYSFSDGLIAEMSDRISPYPSVHIGGYSPALTNYAPWNNPEKSFLKKDTIEKATAVQGGFALQPHLEKRIRARLLSHLNRRTMKLFGKSVERASSSEVYLAGLFLNLRSQWNNGLFFTNFAHYLAPFQTRQLMDPLLTVPTEWRMQDRFQLHLIDRLDGQLLDIPILSGMRPYEIDRITLTGKTAALQIPSTLSGGILQRDLSLRRHKWALARLASNNSITSPSEKTEQAEQSFFERPDE